MKLQFNYSVQQLRLVEETIVLIKYEEGSALPKSLFY